MPRRSKPSRRRHRQLITAVGCAIGAVLLFWLSTVVAPDGQPAIPAAGTRTGYETHVPPAREYNMPRYFSDMMLMLSAALVLSAATCFTLLAREAIVKRRRLDRS